MQRIIEHIKKSYGKDLSYFSDSFLQKTINQRIAESGSNDICGYFRLLERQPSEIEKLTDSLNLSYSLFFRSSIDFSILERVILPSLFHRNLNSGKSVRIWSAACADGQEPYSLAMLIDDLTQNQYPGIQNLIVATDISELALSKARRGEYVSVNVQNVKFSFLSRYFLNNGGIFLINDLIKHKVEFNKYDLLDTNTFSPPSGIFGGYDIVFCCNLLIYYKPEIQFNILNKLNRSLSAGGFLIVDGSEKSIVKSFKGFRMYSNLGNIFVKNG
jgi:chemotaxis protein methyltransferase CheR